MIRADLPGIDRAKDVELTVSDGILHIEAERREEEKGDVVQELRYGSLSRSLPLPEGVTEADITATYKARVLEIRTPEPKREPAKKIAISKGDRLRWPGQTPGAGDTAPPFGMIEVFIPNGRVAALHP